MGAGTVNRYPGASCFMRRRGLQVGLGALSLDASVAADSRIVRNRIEPRVDLGLVGVEFARIVAGDEFAGAGGRQDRRIVEHLGAAGVVGMPMADHRQRGAASGGLHRCSPEVLGGADRLERVEDQRAIAEIDDRGVADAGAGVACNGCVDAGTGLYEGEMGVFRERSYGHATPLRGPCSGLINCAECATLVS